MIQPIQGSVGVRTFPVMPQKHLSANNLKYNLHFKGEEKPAKKRSWPGFAARFFLEFYLALVAVSGISLGLHKATGGDGPLPELTSLEQSAPELLSQVELNSTFSFDPYGATSEASWQAMEPSRCMVEALSPEINTWLESMYQNNHIEFIQPPDIPGVKEPLVITYKKWGNELTIGPGFWTFSDGYKAQLLIHEYRHSRESVLKDVGNMSYLIVTGKAFNGSVFEQFSDMMEHDAENYEQQARKALTEDVTLLSDMDSKGLSET